MATADIYQVDLARDDPQSLKEVLQHIATRPNHLRIISITWQPQRADGDRLQLHAGYTIVSENK
jgi:hypothetical protein